MPDSNYINRELSWISFNERVLQEAADETVPLLERLKFLGIFSSNLDEFYRVRVANVHREIDLVKDGTVRIKQLGYDPKELLRSIQHRVLNQRKKFELIFKEISAQLSEEGIMLLNEKEVKDHQAPVVRQYFRDFVLRKLVPVLFDEDTEDFPMMKDNLIYLAVKLVNTLGQKPVKYALIEIPTALLSRFFVLPKVDEGIYIMMLDDVIRFNFGDIFTIFDYDHIEAYNIKVTRDAELDLDDDISKSFLQRMSKGLKGRKTGRPVRLTYDKHIDPQLLDIIKSQLDLSTRYNLVPGARYHNFKDFIGFPKVGKKSFTYPKHQAVNHYAAPIIRRLFDTLKEKDLLLHYPYHTFDYNIDLLREAAIDPYVTEIKITIYRVSSPSSLVNALLNALKNGKQVTVLVELQARFDEEANIKLANRLSEEGIRVIQGVRGLKVHSKIILINRVFDSTTERYGVLSTGNFHEKTAKLYSDTSLFTSNRALLDEVENIFQFFETNYKTFDFKHLVVSPFFMREKFYELIDKEIEFARRNRKAYMNVKVNSLVDKPMIDKLYEASRAGVKIKLIVRGICGIKPGIPGLSENIEIISIVDKFLEHSRIFIFGNGGDEKFFISSADWMGRNLNRRLELAIPIYDKDLQKEIRMFFDVQWQDNMKARILDAEQKNKYKKEGKRKIRAQQKLMSYFKSKLTD